jgi:hypothetical protein
VALLNEPITQPARHSARISRPAQQPRRTIAPHPADEVRRVLARQLGLHRPCRIEGQDVDMWRRRRSSWIAQRGELCKHDRRCGCNATARFLRLRQLCCRPEVLLQVQARYASTKTAGVATTKNFGAGPVLLPHARSTAHTRRC